MTFPEEAFLIQDHLKPQINISPFSAGLKLDSYPVTNDSAEVFQPVSLLNEGADKIYLSSGRDALEAALVNIGLNADENVLIIKTSQGPYISSCVTSTIRKVCDWTRELNEFTRAVLVIHEFGFPCIVPDELLQSGLPIIEDCAYALGSRLMGADIGLQGDYAVYSLPKFYPLPFGGWLVSKAQLKSNVRRMEISPQSQFFLNHCIKGFGSRLADWNKARQANWRYFQEKLGLYGVNPYFDLEKFVVPGAFVLRFSQTQVLEKLGQTIKNNLIEAGVESTEYYGQNGFYFPVHQCLSDFDKEYICHHFAKGINGFDEDFTI